MHSMEDAFGGPEEETQRLLGRCSLGNSHVPEGLPDA